MKMSTLQALINLYEEEEQKCLSAGRKNIYTRFVIVNYNYLILGIFTLNYVSIIITKMNIGQ